MSYYKTFKEAKETFNEHLRDKITSRSNGSPGESGTYRLDLLYQLPHRLSAYIKFEIKPMQYSSNTQLI